MFSCCLWLLRGKAHLKAEIARRIKLDVSILPYNESITSLLLEERLQGRKLYLCTASDQRLAHEVAAHLACFDGVFASDGKVNLSSRNKARILKQEFGEQGLDYCGNSVADLAVWSEARNALVEIGKRT